MPPSRLHGLGKYLPYVTAAFAIVLAGFVSQFISDHQADIELRARAEQRLRMDAKALSVQDYLNQAYITLKVISLDNDLTLLNEGAQDDLDRALGVSMTGGHFSKLLLTRQDSFGVCHTVMASTATDSNHDTRNQGLDSSLVLSACKVRETLRLHPENPVACSPLITYRTGEATDSLEEGIAMAVPVVNSTADSLVLVGMLPLERISNFLEQNNYHTRASIASEDGDLICIDDLEDSARTFLQNRIVSQGVAHFFQTVPDTFSIRNWAYVWRQVRTPSATRWWLLYGYDSDFYVHANDSTDVLVKYASTLSVLFFGLTVAVILHIIRRRNAEQARFYQARLCDQERTERSVSLLNATLESTADGILVVDNDGAVVSFNRKYIEIWRIPFPVAEGSEDQRVLQYVLAQLEDPDYLQLRIDQLRADKAPESFDLVRLKDGRILELYSTLHVVGAKAEGGVWSMRDVTGRLRSDLALRQSEEHFRNIFENSPIGVTICTLDLSYKRVNKSICTMLGYTPEEMLTMNARQVTYADDQDQKLYPMDQVLRGEIACIRMQKRYVKKSGELMWANLIITPLRDNAGEVEFLLAMIEDITEKRKSEESLRASEEYLRTIVKSMPDVLFTLNAEGAFTSLSPVFETLLGWRVDDWIGEPFIPIVHPNDAALSLDRLNYTLSGQPVPSFELRLASKSGNYVPFEIKPALVKLPNGDVGILAIARDLTERYRTQEQIRKLHKAVEQSPVTVVITDCLGNIEYVNPKFCQLTGYSSQEACGQNPRLLKSGLLPDAVYRDLWETISSGRVWQGRLCNRKKNGELYWENASISPMFDEEKKITHYLAVKEDITDGVQKESELRKLSAAVMQSANVVVITDTQRRIEFVNPQFSEVTGYSFEDAVGKSICELRTVQTDTAALETMWETVAGGARWNGSLLNHRKDGSAYWERDVVSPIFDITGTITNYLIVGEDITAELTSQQKLIESDKLSAIGVLAAGVSHEFKNYLGGIMGNASFALEEINADPDHSVELARDTLSQIIDMSEKANQVAMSLLTYSKAAPEEFAKTSLKALILNTLTLVEKEMRSQEVELATFFEELPDVEVSASKIQQLLLNLLINARQAIAGPGVITVVLQTDGHSACLKVADTGVGIPPQNIAKVFDPFFSTKGVWGRDKVVGTGMGLAICRNVAREHNGDLTVESAVGVGTTFTLTLPLCAEPVALARDTLVRPGGQRCLIFSYDRSIFKQYFADASALHVELFPVNNLANIGVLGSIADLVVCDARFPGKVELMKVAEACVIQRIPYVMVNCGAMEYQLSHLYDEAAANFKELPEFSRILAELQSATDVHSTAADNPQPALS